MMQIGKIELSHPVIAAPLCGITLKPYRKLVKKFGADLVFTQMASAKALTMGDQKSKKILEFDESERPIGMQIFGNDAETLSEAAKIVQDLKPDLLDLNMGCPAKKIVSDGGGSALLKDALAAEKIFKKMRAALQIPFTIKMRAGWDKNQNESLTIAKIAQDCGVDAVTLHARTRAQGYSGRAEWDLIAELKQNLSIPVIGNGDVTTIADVDQMISQTGCDGVMIGRAMIEDPWFFKSYLEKKDFQPTKKELREIILEQYESFFDYFGFESGLKNMRKHLCAYTKGMRSGSEFRNQIVRMSDWKQISVLIESFFSDEENITTH